VFRTSKHEALRGHAPLEKGGVGWSFKRELLHEDYFYNHAEPHRRRPTLVTFPCFVTHTATLYGDNRPQSKFKGWLMMFAESTWRRRHVADSPANPVPWQACDAVETKMLDRFSRIAQPSLDEEKQIQKELVTKPIASTHDDDVEFALELVHRDHAEIVARIEAHSEFFTLTLFQVLSGPFDIATVYDEYGSALVPGDRPDPENPFHKLYLCLLTEFAKKSFAHFKGVVVGPKAFHSAANYPVAPTFPPPGECAPIPCEVATSTAMFLRGQKDMFKKGLFAASDKDVVACYFQRGQVIYVSALGAQGNVASQDELRYLLIYNKEPLSDDEYDSAGDRYRLSRLVHRVNTIGTLRLAALRDLRQLRRAGKELRLIETGLEIAAHDQAPRSRAQKLGGMIGRLDRMIRWYADNDTPLLYRTARARLYFDQMKKLLEDLGADPIPQWQSYNQFVSRRLFAQLEFTARLGNRIAELWELARTRAEAAEADALRWLQWAAQIASLVLLPLAVADMVRDRTPLRSVVLKAWAWVPGDLQNWWYTPGTQEFWLVYALTFCIWFAVILFRKRPRE
jgi:hypothetical protein